MRFTAGPHPEVEECDRAVVEEPGEPQRGVPPRRAADRALDPVRVVSVVAEAGFDVTVDLPELQAAS